MQEGSVSVLRRGSILKKSSEQKKGVQTTAGQSVTFKEHVDEPYLVGEFREDSPVRRIEA
jgi:hypothetical protein